MSELWARKSLIAAFAINDLVIRYKSSILGFFWAILEPLAVFSVLYVILTYVIKSHIENYPIYLLLGIIMWNFFARGTTTSLGSLASRGEIITRIYFPREILPISSTVTAFIMMLLEFTVFFAFVIFFRFIPPITILILPVILGLEFVLVLALSFPLSVFNARYRDAQYIWNLLLYVGFFATPIFYSSQVFPVWVNKLLLVNPMAQILDIAHKVVLEGTLPSLSSIGYLVIVPFGLLFIGYLLFRVYEPKFVEWV